MEYLNSLPERLSDLAAGLLGVVDDVETRDALGQLLGQIADCVSLIGDGIEAGRHATEQCAALDVYIASIHGLVSRKVGESTARRLTFWLEHVASAPAYYEAKIGTMILSEIVPARWNRSNRFHHSQQVKQVAGTLRAVANLVLVRPF